MEAEVSFFHQELALQEWSVTFNLKATEQSQQSFTTKASMRESFY